MPPPRSGATADSGGGVNNDNPNISVAPLTTTADTNASSITAQMNIQPPPIKITQSQTITEMSAPDVSEVKANSTSLTIRSLAVNDQAIHIEQKQELQTQMMTTKKPQHQAHDVTRSVCAPAEAVCQLDPRHEMRMALKLNVMGDRCNDDNDTNLSYYDVGHDLTTILG